MTIMTMVLVMMAITVMIMRRLVNPGHKNNADDYGDKHDVLYLALI